LYLLKPFGYSKQAFQIPLPHADLITPAFYIKNVLPIGALSAGTIVFGMSSYLYLTVSFVQMVKAFTPVMTMVLVALFGLGYPSKRVVGCVVVICCGTAIAGAGEINFNAWGVCMMLFAQMCEALKLVYTQKILQNFRFDVIEALYYVTPVSAMCVLVASLWLEVPYMTEETFSIFQENSGAFLLAGIFAFTTNLVNAFVIQISSALTLKLVATARNAVLVLFNAFVMMEVVTGTQFVGYSISISAFVAYNYIKHIERQQVNSK
jgi:drug/metabolite transporter (DMT)-like permease